MLHWSVVIRSCFYGIIFSEYFSIFRCYLFSFHSMLRRRKDMLFLPNSWNWGKQLLTLLHKSLMELGMWYQTVFYSLVHCDPAAFLVNPLIPFSFCQLMVMQLMLAYLLWEERKEQDIISKGGWYKNNLALAIEYVFVLALEPGRVWCSGNL